MKRISQQQKEQARPAYEEGGRGVGRQLIYNPSAEPSLWKMLGSLKLWPRWYLQAFARLWADENPTEYERIRKRRYRKGKRKDDEAVTLKATREQAQVNLLNHFNKKLFPDSCAEGEELID